MPISTAEFLVLEELIKPVKIPAFSFTDSYGNRWSFKGAEVSRHILEIETCSYQDNQVLYCNVDKLLTLQEHGALLMLAVSAICGTGNFAGVDDSAVQGAKEIFYHKLALSFRGSNPGCDRVYLWTGEWTPTVVFFEGPAENGYIAARVHERPAVVRGADTLLHYCLGEVTKTRIPSTQGVAEVTSDGLLNPATGFPFAVKQDYEKPQFTSRIEDMVRDYARQHNVSNPAITRLVDILKNDSAFGVDWAAHLIAKEVDIPWATLDLAEALQSFRPGYFISHKKEDAVLPGSNPVVMMVGRDDCLGNPHNICFAANNFEQCGISVRPVRKAF